MPALRSTPLAFLGAALAIALLSLLGACDGKTELPARSVPKVSGDADKPKAGSKKAAGDKATTNKVSETKDAPENTIHFDGGLNVFLTPGKERVEAESELLGGQSRPLEFLVVGQGGALHESLLRVRCKASHLKDGLELIGLKEGKNKLSFRGQNMMPEGDKVDVSVRWRDAAGKVHEHPIEDWVYNKRTKKAMERGPWIFTGAKSRLREDTGRLTFEPDFTGNIIATWRDPGCVIDNPRKHGLDSSAYSIHPEGALPHAGSEVTLVFRASK